MDSAYSRKFPYLYRGVVESNVDPEHIGRCKIRVPFVHGELKYPVDALPWARPIVPSPVKKQRGSVNIPDVGDIVWVFFEGAVKEFPVYLGGTYAKGEITTDPDVVDFYIEGQDKISYHRKDREYTISIGETKIVVSPKGISLLGDIEVEGDFSVRGSLDIQGNLSVGNDVDISGDLSVSGSVSIPDILLDMEGW